MKKITIILVIAIGISLSLFAQSAGDYRSVGSGNWNDPTVWETYDGSTWANTSTYPGQNPGTGGVTIVLETGIKITATVPHPIASLYVDGYYDDNGNYSGRLAFSSENAVSLTVSWSIVINGVIDVEDQNGAKTHSLSIGSSLYLSTDLYTTYGVLGTLNQDDTLHVIFNTTVPSSISNYYNTAFEDVTFNGIGISFWGPLDVYHAANFINGIVRGNEMRFFGHATASGASNASFVDGKVSRWDGGLEPFTFPIGNGNVYAPLTVSSTGWPLNDISARYIRSNASDLGPISDTGLFNVSNCEYWLLHSGCYSNVTVSWNTGSGCGSSSYVTNPSEVTLAVFNSVNGITGSWDKHGGSGSGTTTNGSVTWSGFNGYPDGCDWGERYVTLANLSSVCNPPPASALNATNISSNSATLNWSAVSGAASYDIDYKKYNSGIWINAATATTSRSINLSGLNYSTTYAWKVRANCSSTSSSAYRQAQFLTLGLCGTPSGLSATNVTFNSATLSWDPVPNAINYNVQFKQSSSTAWLTATTGITSPSYAINGLLANTAYDWRVLANCNEGHGNYAQSSFTTACNDFYETNNTSSRAKAISLGAVISASISSTTDVDWFKATMSNNSTLKVTLSNLPADYDLYVYSRNLKLVGSSTATGTSNEVVIFSPARDATYYIKVIGKNGANARQCYNLLAQAVGSGGLITSASSDRSDEMTDGSDRQWLYPNPASDFVYLRFNSLAPGPSDAEIINAVGQLVKKYPVVITKGFNQARIPVRDIGPGMYLLKINKGEFMLVRKFVIAR